MPHLPGPVLSIDLGDVRTGIAVCDDLGLLAVPRGVLTGLSRDALVAEIIALAAKEKAALVVVGLPLNMDGSEGPRAKVTREFGTALEAAGSPRVIYHDERLTSYDAESRLHAAGHRRRKHTANASRGGQHKQSRKPSLEDKSDAVAAALILESWIEQQRG
jgi:putative Holliday junction resolvase